MQPRQCRTFFTNSLHSLTVCKSVNVAFLSDGQRELRIVDVSRSEKARCLRGTAGMN